MSCLQTPGLSNRIYIFIKNNYRNYDTYDELIEDLYKSLSIQVCNNKDIEIIKSIYAYFSDPTGDWAKHVNDLVKNGESLESILLYKLFTYNTYFDEKSKDKNNDIIYRAKNLIIKYHEISDDEYDAIKMVEHILNIKLDNNIKHILKKTYEDYDLLNHDIPDCISNKNIDQVIDIYNTLAKNGHVHNYVVETMMKCALSKNDEKVISKFREHKVVPKDFKYLFEKDERKSVKVDKDEKKVDKIKTPIKKGVYIMGSLGSLKPIQKDEKKIDKKDEKKSVKKDEKKSVKKDEKKSVKIDKKKSVKKEKKSIDVKHDDKVMMWIQDNYLHIDENDVREYMGNKSGIENAIQFLKEIQAKNRKYYTSEEKDFSNALIWIENNIKNLYNDYKSGVDCTKYCLTHCNEWIHNMLTHLPDALMYKDGESTEVIKIQSIEFGIADTFTIDLNYKYTKDGIVYELDSLDNYDGENGDPKNIDVIKYMFTKLCSGVKRAQNLKIQIYTVKYPSITSNFVAFEKNKKFIKPENNWKLTDSGLPYIVLK